MITAHDDLVSPYSPDATFSCGTAVSTPITSPEPSPCKRLHEARKTDLLDIEPYQLDGTHSDEYERYGRLKKALGSEVNSCRHSEHAHSSDIDHTGILDNTHSTKLDHDDVLFRTPQQASRGVVPASRLPAVLLHSRSRGSAVHRQSDKGIDHCDRFLPARMQTPTKERLHTMQFFKTSSAIPETSSTKDPFMPHRRPLQSAQHFTVTRYPTPALRPYGLAGTRVQHSTPRSSMSTHSVWAVGGFPVTEGVLSIENGRGGRVTSGTNAPLYNADLLFTAQQQEDESTHAQRLALALNIEHTGKMIKTADTSIPPFGLHDTVCAQQRTSWKDGHWHTPDPPLSKRKSEERSKSITAAFRVLDAPNLRNDYYCTLLAYSPTLHCVAVGLHSHVYYWWDKKARHSNNLRESMMFPVDDGHVTSLSFSSEIRGKSILAIGFSDGRLILWDPREDNPRLTCHLQVPVSNVSFRPYPSQRPSIRDPHVTIDTEELLIGEENGEALLYSVEWPDKEQSDLFGWASSMTYRSTISCNTQQICGIAWSFSGEMFAVGGNDNQLFVFDFAKLEHARDRAARALSNDDQHTILPGDEKQRFKLNAAVKAIAFAPWQPSLLAARGGSNDRCIHFLHTTSGTTLATINCHAQVTSLIWNESRKEIAATLGFAQPDHPFRIVVFSWPSCRQMLSVSWPNESRALYAISYPGGAPSQRDCIVVATSDHSIKFHEVWSGGKGVNCGASSAKSQILNDICSEALESELQIR